MMQDIVDIRFSKSELNTLVKTKGSCVTLEKKTRVVFLLPSQLLDIKTGIRENLDSHLLKYDYETKAIIIGYEKIKILSKYGSICYGYSKIALRIEASFYLFKPKVGSILEGVVCKQSGRHLGCLVLKGFNISIPLEDDACGWDFSIGQDIKFTVVKLDLTSGPLPYILGKLNPGGADRGAVSEVDGMEAVVSRPPINEAQGEGPWGKRQDGKPDEEVPRDRGGPGDGGRDSLINRLLKTVEKSLGDEAAEVSQPPSKKQKRASVGPGAILAVSSPPSGAHLPVTSPPSAGNKVKHRNKAQGGSGTDDSSGSIIDRLLEMSKRELLGVSEEMPTPRGKKRKADGSPLVTIKKEQPDRIASAESDTMSVESTKSPQKHAKVKRKSLTLKSESF